MRVINVTRRVSSRALAEAERVLAAGGVVAFPTETSYGLAADPSNARAVAKIYAIKRRPKKKPLPLVASSFTDAARRLAFTPAAQRLAREHWPGPLTLVLPLRKGVRLAAAAGERTAAVRVPSSAWARAIAHACGGLATSTSANVSGDAAIYDPAAIRRAFGKSAAKPDVLLDMGTLPPRPASSIIGFKNGTLIVLRDGSVARNILRLPRLLRKRARRA